MGTGYEVHRLVVRTEDDLVDILNNLTSNTEVILREGTHTAASQILIPSGLTNVTIRGSEASIIDITYSGDNPIAIQAPASDITFEGFSVVYNGTAGGQTPLFAPIGSGADTIYRLTVKDVNCDFAAGAITFVRWDGEDIDVHNITISGCTLYGAATKGLFRVQLATNRTLQNVRILGNSVNRDTAGGSQVVAVYGATGATAEDIVVSNNSFRNMQEAIWMDFAAGTCENVTWVANIIKYADLGNAGCYLSGAVSHVLIDSNIFITPGANFCLTITGSATHIHASDNVFIDSPGDGLIIGSSVTESTFDNNVVINCAGDGIRCAGARNKFSGNIVIDVDDYGMDISGNNCAVDGCYVYSNGTGAGDYGIYITGTECQLNGCYVFNSVDLGFAFGASQISVVGCYAVDCGAGGFAPVGASQRLTYTGCVADGNTGDGFLIAERYSFAVGCHSRSNTGNGFNLTINGQSSMFGACYAYNNGGRGFTSVADNSELYGCMARDNGSDGFGGSWDVVNVCYSYDDGDAAGECGFNLDGASATVTGCQATNSYDHGFALTGNGMNVTGCHARSCGNASGDYGFSVTGDNTNLTGCYADDNHDHNIYVNGGECSLNGCYSIDAGVTSAVASANGIYLVATGSIKVSGCYVLNPNNHGIESTGLEVSISDCFVKEAGSAGGDYGIYVSGSNHKVSNCFVDDSYDHGIVLAGGSSTAIGCYVWDAGQTSTTAAYGIHLAALRCSAKNCFVEDSYDTGIVAAGGRNSVAGCTVVDAGSAAGDYGIHVSSTSSRVSDCDVYNSYDHGIYVAAEDCSVKSCEVEDAGQSGPVATACGIALNAASYTQVNDNRVKNSEDHGLWLVGSSYVQVNDNYLRNNGDYGVVEDATSDYCLYDGNFCIGNVTGAKDLNGSFRKQGTNSW